MGMVTETRIDTTLLGCALGDAFGMPTEGMSYHAIHSIYPNGITELLSSMNYALTNRRFPAGSITDDTLHSLLLIDALYHHIHDFSSDVYLEYLAQWYKTSPIANQVIGPSTLKAIKAQQEGKVNIEAKFAVSNGAIMKIFPIGLIFEEKADIVDYVCRVTEPTHASNICLSSAAVVAYLVSNFSRNKGSLDDLQQLSNEMIAYCEGIGFDMPSASLQVRIQQALDIAEQYEERSDFQKALYDQIGSSIYCTETLPCVLAILRYTKGDLYQCASICASIGGDTDTIGAIACSLCGALGQKLHTSDLETIQTINHIEFQEYVQKIQMIQQEILKK